MKKLRLNVDALAVESYETASAPAADRGTVQAHIPTNPWCAAQTVVTYCPDTLNTCPPPRD